MPDQQNIEYKQNWLGQFIKEIKGTLIMKNRNETNAIDPDLIGEWRRDNERIYFDAAGFYFIGDIAIAYTLDNQANTLTLSGTIYHRLSHNTGTIVGNWRNFADGEEVYYRTDGRYLGLWDDDPLAFFGTYAVNQNQFTNLECRARFETNANQILFFSFSSNPESLPYTIAQDTLTLTTASGDLVYTRF